ncbi:penicillin-binding protein 4* [Rhodobiaceae bacterium]|nr:penicillin-binding protein 4* [Rhodobiaceae bacterium]
MDPSFCVIEKNRVLLQDRETDVFPLYSITKTIIAALIFDLGLEIDRPASHWLDESWLPRGNEINLQHLLTHTSGLRDYFSVATYHAAVQNGGTAWSDNEFAQHTVRQPLLFEPGQGWAYSNPGYWALKRVCELESGMSFTALVRKHINHGLLLPSLKAVSGLFSEDLPQYEAGWVWHGLVCGNACDTAQFMASDLVSRLARQLVPVPNAGPTFPDAAYGLGVMGDLSGTNYGHNGSGPGFSTSCFHFPKSGITVSCLLPYDGPEDAAYAKMQALAKQFGAI